jgi:L-asparaginase II
MSDPALVEVTRGGIVESVHRGALAVVDADGGLVLSLGDIERPVFPRSAVKGIQALVMMESGAPERFDLTSAEIALACASHSGEPRHAETAAFMLKKARRPEKCLECGAHWPLWDKAALALAKTGKEPTALHNNCSGKHAGFICAAVALDEDADTRGYINPSHPIQRAVTAALESMCKVRLDEGVFGIDGCSIPTWAIPLKKIAHGFARFGAGADIEPQRGRAIRRIRQAVAAEPFMVAGTGRFDTKIMEALRERAFTKTGAEGVFCAALPEVGLGVALKIDDGATRAAEVVMASLIKRFLDLNDTERAAVDAAINVGMTNWNGKAVGDLRPTAALAG